MSPCLPACIAFVPSLCSFWCAGQLSDDTGALQLNFSLSDAVTRFHVSVDAFTVSTAPPTHSSASELSSEHPLLHPQRWPTWTAPSAEAARGGTRFGRSDLYFASALPFAVDFKLPFVLSQGDQLQVRVWAGTHSTRNGANTQWPVGLPD